MITASLKINVPAEKHRAALQTVRSILGWTRAQPGCISMAFYQDTDASDIMMLFEEWEDWDRIEKHIRSDSYRNILELMELSSAQPEIKFCSVTNIKGIELLEKLRDK
jgi:quinol monooxygenase YgiN